MENSRSKLQECVMKDKKFHLKIQSDLILTLTTPPKVKLMVQSHVLLTKLLSLKYTVQEKFDVII